MLTRLLKAVEKLGAIADARPLRQCTSVGPGVLVSGRPTVRNDGKIFIGARVRLESVPVASHLVSGPSGVLRLGDDVQIGHGAALAAFSQISIGSGTRIGPLVIIMDTDFHAAGQRELAHDALPVIIGRGVRIGPRVTILRGTEIGDGSEVLAGSVVSGAVPAGVRVGGVPARILGKAGTPVAEASSGGAQGEVAEEVPRVVATTFALGAAPDLGMGPAQIPGWDSLGSLRLLLALEETFGVSLGEEAVVKAKTVGDLVAALERATEARAQSQ